MNRKSFIRNSSMAALGLSTPAARALAGEPAASTPAAAPGSTHPVGSDPIPRSFLSDPASPKVRMAIIGTGLRGQNHLSLLLRRDDVDLVAIADIDDYMLSRAKDIITKSGKKMPQVYTDRKSVV